MTDTPQADDLAAIVEQAADRMSDALAPLVRLVQQRDSALAALVPAHAALQESHAALLELIDRMAVRPNWAQDVRTLEQARALQALYAPTTQEPTP